MLRWRTLGAMAKGMARRVASGHARVSAPHPQGAPRCGERPCGIRIGPTRLDQSTHTEIPIELEDACIPVGADVVRSIRTTAPRGCGAAGGRIIRFLPSRKNRNFYFEAWRNLAETVGEASVSVFHVAQGERPSSWHMRLLHHVNDVGATHVITHIESDPGSEGASWTWDTAWGLLSSAWDGVLLGVMFDSAFEWIAARGRLLARMSPRFMIVDICMPMDGSMVRGRPEVGPVNMPVSAESLALVDERLAQVRPEFDLSFIGVMYPYRMALISRLRASGVSVAINPHRPDGAEDDAASRIAQPSWLDYMAGLRLSRMTLNFSQSSAGRFEQLKTRVLEATLAGTLLLTDDIDRTGRFWVPGEEYVYFRSAETAGPVIAEYLSDPVRITNVAAAGELRARRLARTHFWGGIDRGLGRRRLPTLGFGAVSASPPAGA